MKTSCKKTAVLITSIAILLVSLTVFLCDVFIGFNIGVHPVLNFLFCLAGGFGIFTLILGAIKKSPLYFFIGAFLLGLAILYVLLQITFWWVAVISVVIIWIIFAIVCIIICGNQTENIALNKSSDYKNYKQRKAEKEESEEKKDNEKKQH